MDKKHEDVIRAFDEGRVIILPFRIPREGDFVYEVIDASYPVVKSKITSFNGRYYRASAQNVKAAGEIEFSPFDIGRDLFLTKDEAMAEKRRRKKNG